MKTTFIEDQAMHHGSMDNIYGATSGTLATMLFWLMGYFSKNADDLLHAACIACISAIVGYTTSAILRFVVNKVKRWVNLWLRRRK